MLDFNWCFILILGLYRLCGSETKKSLLREAFEEDPETVDLSSENVPDINVITSKFKGKFVKANLTPGKNTYNFYNYLV